MPTASAPRAMALTMSVPRLKPPSTKIFARPATADTTSGQHVHRADAVVQLAAAMVGDIDHLDAVPGRQGPHPRRCRCPSGSAGYRAYRGSGARRPSSGPPGTACPPRPPARAWRSGWRCPAPAGYRARCRPSGRMHRSPPRARGGPARPPKGRRRAHRAGRLSARSRQPPRLPAPASSPNSAETAPRPARPLAPRSRRRPRRSIPARRPAASATGSRTRLPKNVADASMADTSRSTPRPERDPVERQAVPPHRGFGLGRADDIVPHVPVERGMRGLDDFVQRLEVVAGCFSHDVSASPNAGCMIVPLRKAVHPPGRMAAGAGLIFPPGSGPPFMLCKGRRCVSMDPWMPQHPRRWTTPRSAG